MKIISKTLIKDKVFFKHLIISIILIFTFLLISSIQLGLEQNINNFKNISNYRTIIVKIDNVKVTYKDLKRIDYIEKIEILDENNYELILKDYKDIDIFKNTYKNNLDSITTTNIELPVFLIISNNFLNILLIILTICILLLIILNITETITTRIKSIAFYKLLGFKSKTILKYFITILIFIYTIIYIISIITNLALTKLVNKLLFEYKINFKLINLSYKLVINYYFSIIIFILFIFIILYAKIKKTTPIKLINKNNY